MTQTTYFIDKNNAYLHNERQMVIINTNAQALKCQTTSIPYLCEDLKVGKQELFRIKDIRFFATAI